VKLRDARDEPDPDDNVFTDPSGQPLSQEWLYKRVWLSTLQRAGLRPRGQYNVRDSFISIALSAGRGPWLGRERLRHVGGDDLPALRTWIPGLNPDAGSKVGRILGGVGGGNLPPAAHPRPKVSAEMQRDRLLKVVEAGGIEPPSEGPSWDILS
jgi:hypothetical protein